MKVLVAESSGFCFGVDRAVNAVNSLLDKGKRVYTLGPIIHNPQVVSELEKQGVVIVDSPIDVPDNAVLVIRSHGVPRDTYQEISRCGIEALDATCPFVFKIHKIVEKESAAGAAVIIAGNEGHPEVTGIRGHCYRSVYVISSVDDIIKLYKDKILKKDDKITMVAQTTFNASEWEKCSEIAKKLYTNLEIFDTICNATAERQNEAIRLAKSCDLMVIVGGRESSNTAKLRDVCAEHCPTCLIEKADELDPSVFRGIRTVGLTAGASTPSDIIKEVLSTMSEIINNENEIQEAKAPDIIAENNPETVADTVLQAEPEKADTDTDKADDIEVNAPEESEPAPEKSFEEMSFAEALEASLEGLTSDDRVRGVVVGIAPNEVQVEVVGRKQTGYIPIEELSAEPVANPEDIVKVGDEMDLLIMRTNDQEGTIMLSKKRVDALKGWDKVVAAEQSDEVLDGIVTDVVKGGVLAVTNGVRVFIPASHASAVRMEDLSPLLRQHIRFKIIETNKSRRRAVGSARLVAREEQKTKEAAFWETIEIGQRFTGKVKSLTSYGAFVDLGGIDGMIHISQMSWQRIKHPSDVVKVGDTVDVYIRDLDKEKRKISLGYRKSEDNPWEIFKAEFPVGSVVKAKIVGMTSFGAFAQIIPGIDGLIHISQIADRRIEKPQDELKIGQEVTAKIINIDFERKRISLSIRALIEDSQAAEVDPEEKKPEAEEKPEAAEQPVEQATAEVQPVAQESAAEEQAEVKEQADTEEQTEAEEQTAKDEQADKDEKSE